MDALNDFSNTGRRLVVSGTYGVGKTTTTQELMKVIGLQGAVAGGMRDILAVLFPEKTLEQCSGSELFQLIMYRYGERRAREGQLQEAGFVSDGSALHEWAYGKMRVTVGANGPESRIKDPGYDFSLNAFGDLVIAHAKNGYDDIIHLPVEFPIPQDGHRPVSEDFRQAANQLIIDTWKSLGKNVITVTGSVENRINSIVKGLGLQVSPTLNGGKILSPDSVYFGRAEDMLGDPQKRFFSNGFRNAQHEIHNVTLNTNEGDVGATGFVNLDHFNWSKKKGQVCKPHFTSVDAILISGQLSQMILFQMDNVSRENAGNLWLRSGDLRPGNKAIENLQNVPVRLIVKKTRLIKKGGRDWRLADIETQFGGNKEFIYEQSFAYELPEKPVQ